MWYALTNGNYVIILNLKTILRVLEFFVFIFQKSDYNPKK